MGSLLPYVALLSDLMCHTLVSRCDGVAVTHELLNPETLAPLDIRLDLRDIHYLILLTEGADTSGTKYVHKVIYTPCSKTEPG